MQACQARQSMRACVGGLGKSTRASCPMEHLFNLWLLFSSPGLQVLWPQVPRHVKPRDARAEVQGQAAPRGAGLHVQPAGAGPCQPPDVHTGAHASVPLCACVCACVSACMCACARTCMCAHLTCRLASAGGNACGTQQQAHTLHHRCSCTATNGAKAPPPP